MYTMASLVGALLLTVALLVLIWINFRWHYKQPPARHLKWFHLGSVALALFIIVRLYLISLLGLWRQTFYEQVGWVTLVMSLIAYVLAAKSYFNAPFPQDQANKNQLPLEALFRSLEDKVYIYDSDFRLTAQSKETTSPSEPGPISHLREYLYQFSSDMPPDQLKQLDTFFQHKKAHQSLTQFKWLSHSLKSYVVLSKVLDTTGDWVGTVMLVHGAEDELMLMASMETQNQQHHDLNLQLEASLQKLCQFGYEEEKDRLLQEINQSMMEGTHQAIRTIQAIEKDDQMTLEDKQKAITHISQGVSDVYKHLRQTVRQMAIKSQGEKP